MQKGNEVMTGIYFLAYAVLYSMKPIVWTVALQNLFVLQYQKSFFMDCREYYIYCNSCKTIYFLFTRKYNCNISFCAIFYGILLNDKFLI